MKRERVKQQSANQIFDSESAFDLKLSTDAHAHYEVTRLKFEQVSALEFFFSKLFNSKSKPYSSCKLSIISNLNATGFGHI